MILDHALMENSSSLVIDVTVTLANGSAKPKATQAMMKRTTTQSSTTLFTDRPIYVPVVTRRHDGYRKWLKVCKRIEEVFGWEKIVDPLRQT